MCTRWLLLLASLLAAPHSPISERSAGHSGAGFAAAKSADRSWIRESREIAASKHKSGPKSSSGSPKCRNITFDDQSATPKYARMQLPFLSPVHDPKQPVTTSVVFIKIHKTGSATLQTILYQFALRHRLRIYTDKTGFPNAFEQPQKADTWGAPQTLSYNMIGSHSIMNIDNMLQTVPGAKFVTMIRSPVKCLRSFVATFGQCDVVAAANFNFTRFAKRAFMARDKLPTTVQRSRNPNAQALGFYDWAFSLAGHGAIGLQYQAAMGDYIKRFSASSSSSSFESSSESSSEGRPPTRTAPRHTRRSLLGAQAATRTLAWTIGVDQEVRLARDWVKYVASKVRLVMLFERYDESLLLLQRELNWGLKDMIYLRAHSGKYKSCNLAREALGRGELPEATVAALRPYMMVDHLLYDYFGRVLDKRIAAEEDACKFQNDLNLLRALNAREAERCSTECGRSCSMCVPCGHVIFQGRQRMLENYVRNQQRFVGGAALPPAVESYRDLPDATKSPTCEVRDIQNFPGMRADNGGPGGGGGGGGRKGKGKIGPKNRGPGGGPRGPRDRDVRGVGSPKPKELIRKKMAGVGTSMGTRGRSPHGSPGAPSSSAAGSYDAPSPRRVRPVDPFS